MAADFRAIMVTAGQIRAARSLLGLTQEQLAVKAGVSTKALIRLERDDKNTRLVTLERVTSALEREGVRFISGDGVIGVQVVLKENRREEDPQQ